jgi:hypothetical protein
MCYCSFELVFILRSAADQFSRASPSKQIFQVKLDTLNVFAIQIFSRSSCVRSKAVKNYCFLSARYLPVTRSTTFIELSVTGIKVLILDAKLILV